MHLNSLSIRNFKKYRRAKIDFQDGLTGVVGGNGTGKSTIVEAIAWALYGNKASTIRRDLIKNTSAAENEPVQVILKLYMGKHELTISRGMRGKAMAPEAALAIDGRAVAAGSKEVDLRLEEILKISFQDFMKTFYARQKDLDNLLKEGGTGKREYLLKLLGLDEIREWSVEQIRSDHKAIDDQKNRLSGAIAEIGDVGAKIEEVTCEASSASQELKASKERDANLAAAAEDRRRELESLAEKRRACDLLSEKIAQLLKSVQEQQEIVKADVGRLELIERSKSILAGLEPKLIRLKEVKARIDLLEPKRKEYDLLQKRAIRTQSEIEGLERILKDAQQKLAILHTDRSKLEACTAKENEYRDLQEALVGMEEKRDRHKELQMDQKEEMIRLDSAKKSLSRVENTIKQLHKARTRFAELSPLIDEDTELAAEIAELICCKDQKKELDGLVSRKTALDDRSRRLAVEKKTLQDELALQGDLKARDAELKKQDADLDNLRADLVNMREALRGDLKVFQSKEAEARLNLSRVKNLGAGGACPTCERPLDGQYSQLVEKYERASSGSRQQIAGLEKSIQDMTDRINAAIAARSNLKRAFDEFNSKKARRAELLAGLRSLELQINETAFESTVLTRAIADIGQVIYDPKRLEWAIARQEQLRSIVDEHRSLALRLNDLPGAEAEENYLEKEMKALDQRIQDLNQKIAGLAYLESEYQERKRRLSELKSSHESFVLLSQKVLEIPEIVAKIMNLRSTEERLKSEASELSRAMEDLGFCPAEYDSSIEEERYLQNEEERAQSIRLEVAAEPEIRQRLEQAASALADLESGLQERKEQLLAISYDEKLHNVARQLLQDAKLELDASRKDVSERQVRLGVIMGNMERLRIDAKRREEYERGLGSLCYRMEVVDTTRNLVNRFMDHILVKIRGEIVRIAGDILDEVSGKYSLIKIDDDFNILVEDGGEYYPISRFSGGEVDMIAVSVRVAISEYLMRFCRDGPGYSFLILDEVFGSQDLEHREKMINMLRSLEDRFPQIIAISHFSDVQGQFDNTILVVEDEMGNSRAEAI